MHPTDQDPCTAIVATCQAISRCYTLGATTADELSCSLLDVVLRAGSNGDWPCVHQILESVPNVVIAELLAYAKAHPEPRFFTRTPCDEIGLQKQREAERNAVGVQTQLITVLERRTRTW